MPKYSPVDSFYQQDKQRFHEAFTAPKEWFLTLGDWYEPRTGDLLVHQDNGKKILIVVHTDFVVPTIPKEDVGTAWLREFGPSQPLPSLPDFGPHKFCNSGKWFPEDNKPVVPEKLTATEEDLLSYDWVARKADKLAGPVVDDRLGCALALGCTAWADILFTDCEEMGMSTAAFFQAPRAYNWIIGLDRRGTDVVTYTYKDKDWLAALEEDFTIGTGSFSDIGYLENLGTACVNMGVGYYNEHTTAAHWKPQDTEEQFARLYKFWSKYGETQFHHIPPKKQVTGVPGRHEGKVQYSLHGREWLLEKEQPVTAASVYTPKTGVYTPQTWYSPFDTWKQPATPTVASKSYGSAASTSTKRFEDTTIKGTVWDNSINEYMSLSDVDLSDQDTIDFIEIHYPEFLADLALYKESTEILSRDVITDPLMRDYSWGF